MPWYTDWSRQQPDEEAVATPPAVAASAAPSPDATVKPDDTAGRLKSILNVLPGVKQAAAPGVIRGDGSVVASPMNIQAAPTMDPEVIRGVMENQKKAAIARAFAGTHTPNWYEVKKGKGMTELTPHLWDAISGTLQAPIASEQARVAQQGADVKAMNESAGMGFKSRIETQKEDAALQGKALTVAGGMERPLLVGAQARETADFKNKQPETEAERLKREAREKAEKPYDLKINPLDGTMAVIDKRTGSIISKSGGVPSNISDEAIRQAAERFNKTGEMPSFGRAQGGIAPRIVNKAAEINPNADVAASKAGFKADTGSLASQQRILDNAEAWERTGKANLDVLLDVAKKLHDTGSPWLNSPVRRFAEKGIGEPNQTAFKAAHATVVNEYAKILSGAQGSSGVTDSARREADSMLPLDATWGQLSAAAKILDTDAGNRIRAARQQVSQIKGRLGGGQPTGKVKKYDPVSGTVED